MALRRASRIMLMILPASKLSSCASLFKASSPPRRTSGSRCCARRTAKGNESRPGRTRNIARILGENSDRRAGWHRGWRHRCRSAGHHRRLVGAVRGGEGRHHGDRRDRWKCTAREFEAPVEASVVVNKADGKFASAHDLRRAFGTRWAFQVKPATLKLLMRHQQIETTMRFYVDQDADDVADQL